MVHLLNVFLHFFYSDILHVDGKNVDAIYVRGMSLYYQDNVEKAFTHFQHVLKAAPDHRKALEIYKVQGLSFSIMPCCLSLLDFCVRSFC